MTAQNFGVAIKHDQHVIHRSPRIPGLLSKKVGHKNPSAHGNKLAPIVLMAGYYYFNCFSTGAALPENVCGNHSTSKNFAESKISTTT